jgi:hypothetical protein
MTHTLPRVLLVTALAGGPSLLAASPAAADAPARTGWWNRAAVGGSSVPYPTTKKGGLHVGNDVQGPNAFAALRYQVAGKPEATLTLQVASNGTVGTPKLQACPVTSDDWKAGADQPWSAAPHYRCAGRSTPGHVSDDGKTVTWEVTGEQQLRPGVLDLAIVPATGSKPFSVDFAKPGADSLSMSSTANLAPPAGNPAPPPSSSSSDDTQGSSGPLSPGKLPADGPASKTDPGADGNVRLPEVASPTGAAAAQAADARQGGLSPDARREIALAALVVTAFALMYAGLQQQRRPLGLLASTTGTAAGRDGEASATSAADTTGGPSTTGRNLSVAAPVRGLGRFARPRSEPPHRL